MQHSKIKPLNLGILGCGSFIQRRILPFLPEISDINLIAIQNRNLDKAKEIATRFNIPYAFSERSDLLNLAELDMVMIATPNSMHEEDALACADAKIATLCEKPLAPTVSAIKRMLTSFTEKSVPFFVGHSLRFKPCVQKTKEMIAGGLIGEIKHIRAFFSIPVSRQNWRFKKNYGGGVLQDIGIHLIDLIQFITGEKIDRIYAHTHMEEVEITVHALATLSNGTNASFDCSFEEPYTSGFEVVGSMARIISLNSLRQTFDPVETFCLAKEDTGHLFLPLKATNIYVEEIKHLTSVLKNQTSSIISADIALHNQKVLEAALVSGHEKREVSVNSLV